MDKKSASYKQAHKISKETGCKVIYMNSKEEFFTSKNLAELSDKKDAIQEFYFTDEAKEELSEAEKTANERAALKKAIISKVAKAKTKEAAQALIEDFEEDEDVKAAIEAKVKELDKE
jgi:hypothetical protein